MSSLVEDFMKSPSQELFEQFTKDQLVEIAQHFGIDIPDKRLKENVKIAVKNKLLEAEILISRMWIGNL